MRGKEGGGARQRVRPGEDTVTFPIPGVESGRFFLPPFGAGPGEKAMAVPKTKKSKSKIGMRKHSHRVKVNMTRPCPNCGAAQRPHRVCDDCGFYRGRQVLTIKAD